MASERATAQLDLPGRILFLSSDPAQVKAQLNGADFALIIGEDELALSEVTVRNLATGTQERVRMVDVVAALSGDVEA